MIVSPDPTVSLPIHVTGEMARQFRLEQAQSWSQSDCRSSINNKPRRLDPASAPSVEVLGHASSRDRMRLQAPRNRTCPIVFSGLRIWRGVRPAWMSRSSRSLGRAIGRPGPSSLTGFTRPILGSTPSRSLQIKILKLLMFHSARSDNASLIFVGEERNIGAPQSIRLAGRQGETTAPRIICTTHRDRTFTALNPRWDRLRDLSRNSWSLARRCIYATVRQTPWAAEPRVIHGPFLAQRRMLAVASREWCAIPETHLPVPWSCDWSKWYGWSCGPELLQDRLRHQYNIPGALNPIMFHNFFRSFTTVFESCGAFYLLEPIRDYVRKDASDHHMYRFLGLYSSVEDFLENCDWNKMQRMERGTSTAGEIVSSTEAPKKLPLTHSGRGMRVAAAEPYGKRNLLGMTRPEGIWSFKPRQDWVNEWLEEEYIRKPAPHTAAWPAIPDAQLPAPFTCAWHAFNPADNWYKTDYRGPSDTQEGLYRYWGVPGLTPVIYMANSRYNCAFNCPTVLRAGDTYCWWLYEMDPVILRLCKFDGTYKNVEDFIENGDWNRMSAPLEAIEGWLRAGLICARSSPTIPPEPVLGDFNLLGEVSWILVQTALSSLSYSVVSIPERGKADSVHPRWPHGITTTASSPTTAFLALEGLSSPNYTGSVGFVGALLGNWGTLDVEDCIATVRHLVKTGVSAGGKGKQFLIGGIIGQFPDVFSAAAIRSPVISTDPLSSDIPDWYFNEWNIDFPIYSSPEGFPEAAESNRPLPLPPRRRPSESQRIFSSSPIAYIDAVTAPVLLHLGGSDLRMTPTHGLEYYHALKGKARNEWLEQDVEMHWFEKGVIPWTA
ncbi:hypothetical protein FB451DRAFT_1184166 [Mycena latifolia]|nr:hypothetical protein FB451DRAFT_1184166 [Mycena latifolia]